VLKLKRRPLEEVYLRVLRPRHDAEGSDGAEVDGCNALAVPADVADRSARVPNEDLPKRLLALPNRNDALRVGGPLQVRDGAAECLLKFEFEDVLFVDDIPDADVACSVCVGVMGGGGGGGPGGPCGDDL
jgi:hypothetical protein